ncbi:anti-sigma factor family protein [Streptomyces sp. NPDC055254]
MTPATGAPGTTGTVRHPDVSEISDLTEGLLSPSRTAEIRRHLGDCALCADVRASLDEIRALLGTLPGPARMPADITGRIDAALAAEALLDATRPSAASAPAVRTGRAGSDVSRETSPPSPAASPTRGPSGHPVGPSGPGRRRARRRIAVLSGLAGAAACALGIFLFTDLSGSPVRDASTRGDTATSAVESSGEGTYTAQGLQKTVHQLLASSGPGDKAVPQNPQAPQEQNNTFGTKDTPPPQEVAPSDRRPSPVPPCVQGATGRPEAPLAAERGTYQGHSVHLLVLPHPGDSSRVDAYLVDAGCETADPAAAGELLLTRTYPRM